MTPSWIWALRGRLSEFDRDTLVAVLSSVRIFLRRMLTGSLILLKKRDNVLQQAERIQQEAQNLTRFKQQAQKQAQETKSCSKRCLVAI